MTLAMSTTGRSSLKRSNGGALLDQVATGCAITAELYLLCGLVL